MISDLEYVNQGVDKGFDEVIKRSFNWRVNKKINKKAFEDDQYSITLLNYLSDLIL